MATISQVLTGILLEVRAATIGMGNVQSAVGWPAPDVLQSLPRAGASAISVYDLKVSRDATRWPLVPVAQSVQTTTLSGVWSVPTIPVGGQSVLTILSTGGPVANDAISCVISPPTRTCGYVVTARAVDTLLTLASSMAAGINADPALRTLVSATASGATVTLVNTSAVPLPVASYAGAIATTTYEVARRIRPVQITVWSANEDEREQIADVLDSHFSYLQANFGIQLPDGTWGRITFAGDRLVETDVQRDVYGRVLYVNVEYGVTWNDVQYAVLAGIGTLSPALITDTI